MKYKIISILIVFLILNSCGSNKMDDSLTGSYVSKTTFNFWDYLFLRTRAFNISLELRPDSTYTLQSCIIENGKWKIVKRKLILNCENIEYKVDSFNHIDKYKKILKCKKQQHTYHIRKSKLLEKYNFRNISELIKK